MTRAPSHLSSVDLVVIIGYFVLTMAIGLAFWARSRSVEGFTAAERSQPGWLVGLSILGTYVSSISFLALPGKAFATNWNPFVFSLAMPLATWIGVKYFLPFYRRLGSVSAYTHLEHRFGPWARIYASAFYLLTQLARIGTVTYLMALPLHVLLGWNIGWLILLTGVTTTLYTFVGGIVAVIWTDAIQTLVLIGGAVACAVMILVRMPGGPGQLFSIALQHDKFSVGSFGPSLSEPTFWVVLLYGFVINLQNFGIDQSYVQRYITASSDREARKSLWLGGLLYLPLSAVFFFIGTALFAYYTTHPADLPPTLRDPAHSDSVFPYFIVTVLPSGLTGLLIASVFAAAMSTISSSLNSSATILLNDFYARYIVRQPSDRQSMRVLYGATLGWGIGGTLIALAMTRVPSALDAWWLLSGIFAGGVLGLFLLGFVSRRVDNRAAIIGVLAGIGVILWMSLSPILPGWPEAWRSSFHGFLVIVFGTFTILVVGLTVGALSRPVAEAESVPVRE